MNELIRDGWMNMEWMGRFKMDGWTDGYETNG